ncbi:hypothetical protein SB658_23830, partial [Bacillus sp. SIMBA_008]|uniref:hypothetical protein n=1 Tax=Bacillus sp. SIMBA_008 TaxID=3085757 RepID=UPI00397DB9DE
AALKAEVPQEPSCPITQVTIGEDWEGIPGGGAGAGADGSNTGEQGGATVDFYYLNPSTSTCVLIGGTRYLQRTREVKCPNINSTIMTWQAA